MEDPPIGHLKLIGHTQAVFVDGVYQARETWTNARGEIFSPALHYYVGGNSKVYCAALLRLREHASQRTPREPGPH
jgi:hypothetical protein